MAVVALDEASAAGGLGATPYVSTPFSLTTGAAVSVLGAAAAAIGATLLCLPFVHGYHQHLSSALDSRE